jgi:hypothetical protein
VKRFANIPPVLLRATSLTDCVLAIAGEVGNLMVLVRRTDGLVAI